MEAIRAIWTQGVQDGIVSGLIVAMLVALAGALVVMVKRLREVLFYILCFQVKVPAWYILLAAFSILPVALMDQRGQLLAIAWIAFFTFMGLLLWLALAFINELRSLPPESDEPEPPTLDSLTDLEKRILRFLLLLSEHDREISRFGLSNELEMKDQSEVERMLAELKRKGFVISVMVAGHHKMYTVSEAGRIVAQLIPS